MINMLMDNEGSNQQQTLPVPSVNKEEIIALQSAKEALEAKVEELETQLELRALRGDYNPDETRVLHFINNPMDNATKRREVDLETLKELVFNFLVCCRSSLQSKLIGYIHVGLNVWISRRISLAEDPFQKWNI